MQRRRFLKLVAVGAGSVLGAPRAAPALTASTVTCDIAGVSFNGYDVFTLQEDAAVVVRREIYRNKICYRVLDVDGKTIGFVPRAKLPLFEERDVRRAWLSSVNPHAVPWKKLQVTVSLT